MQKKILVIVAHPDDETIWMGGSLLKNRSKWKTTIISLCRRDDKDRAPRFKKACKIYRAKCFMSNLEDVTLGNISIKDVISRIKQFTDGKSYDYLFTHGKNGEYGHIRHIEVHKAVKEMLNKKLLDANRCFFFSYIKKGKFCCADKNADKFIKLDSLHLARKKYLIKKIYGFKKNCFEERCCKDTEAFKTKKLK